MCLKTDKDETSTEVSETTEEEDIYENAICIRAKWLYDGCKTIDDIIERLKAEVEYYEKLKSDNYELIDEVQDDYGYLKKKD
jgi:hypothetical protein